MAMACPVLLLAGQNISLFLFFYLLLHGSQRISFFQYQHPIQIVALSFALSSIISVIDVNNTDADSVSLALQVLPNYVYWSVMVWCFVSAAKHLPYQVLNKAIFIGLATYIIYYLFFSGFSISGWLARPSQNSFALVLICFTAPAVVYVKEKYGISYCLIVLIIILFILIRDGRRAGSVLTLASSLGALFLPTISARYLTSGLTVFLTLAIFFTTDLAENMIQTLNPRIYGLIYESDKIATEDRSYLTRKLMIEKGLTIFEEHPLTGIGLNNFDNIEVEFKGEFVGSEFVIEKEGTNETSSHNSYINIIAEGGLLLLIPLLLLMVFNLIQFVLKYNNRNSKINSLYWAFFAMCIHLYFITGIVNVYVWFLIAVCTAASTLSSFTQKT
jgi:O-antigen ligase